MSSRRLIPPRVLSSTVVTPLHWYYDPSDFLAAIPASSLLYSSAGTFLRKSCQDLPRSPHHFCYMPCSQTPGAPHVSALYRCMRCCFLSCRHHQPLQQPIFGAQSLQPMAYGLQPPYLRLTCGVTGTSPRLVTECAWVSAFPVELPSPSN